MAEYTQSKFDSKSYYALRDDWEFIAEAVAEYMGGSPRETARKVMDILLRKD